MEELQLRLFEKQFTTVFLFLGQKGHFFPKNGGTMKNVIALNLYIGTNVLVYDKRLMVKVHDKVFVLKNIFCKNSYIFFKNDPIQNIFMLTSSPKYYNEGF